jgi:hypothetical protein
MRRAKSALVVIAALAGSLPLSAQFNKHNITVGAGAAQPGAALSGLFSPTGFLRVGYAYRVLKNLEVTTGIDTAFLAAGVKDFYESQFGPLRIRDYQYMVPFGGRVVLPFGEDERFRIHAGAGGAYLRYSERSTQPFSNAGIKLECPICNARSGWGTYGSVGGSVAITPGGHFRLGGTVNVYRATTDGQQVGGVLAGPSKDRWINSALEFTFSF